MKLFANCCALLAITIMFLSACAETGDPAPPSAPTLLAATSLAPTLTPAPTFKPPATPQPTASPSPEPTQPPLPTPSSTSLPEITLSVPESWKEEVAGAVEQLNRSALSHLWRLTDSNGADVRLVNEPSGVVVRETALALAVPFTMDWEAVSYDKALAILNEGHESVTVTQWPDMQPDQKALRVDELIPADSGYPLKDTWSLVAGSAHKGALEELAPLLRESHTDHVLHIAAVGDIMLDRSLGYNLQRGDLIYPFADVADRLREADLTVGNVESALGDTGEPEQKRYPFRAPPEAAESLALAGFDIVSLANNHGMDYGEEALLQAVTLLQQQEVMPIGAGANSAAARKPEIVEANGLTTAFFGYANVPVEASTGFDTASWNATEETPGIAWGDPRVIAEDVAAVRDKVDLVVVLLHSGYEYLATPSEPQIEAAHAAVDAGADLVIGHHAHILQGIEHYGNGVIIYGSGNFAFDIIGPPETAIFHIWLDGDGVREVAVEPAIVQFGGQPRLAASWEAPAIRSQVYYLSELLNTN